MHKNAVVIGHFDPNNLLEDNFQAALSCLEQVFDIIVLVTTSDLQESDTAQFKKVITIKRPNIGYDFYSYRVGLNYLFECGEVGSVLLVNSSFLIVDTTVFTRMLENVIEMSGENDVIGVTESRQLGWHLQSYFLLIRSNVLYSEWFRVFFENVQPLNSKLELILSYEIGLSNAFLANGVKTVALFNPNSEQRRVAHVAWMGAITRNSGWGTWLTGKPWRYRQQVNWTHFCAAEIARQFGFVKTEVVRSNPHGIATDFVEKLANPVVLATIRTAIDRSLSRYTAGQNGLTTLAHNSSHLLSSRLATYGVPRAKGVRIAVVIHLFYYELLDEICSYLKGIIEPYDLYVTTPHEGDVHKIINSTAMVAHSVTVCLTENRGRDIGPFTSLFRTGVLDDYLAVLKLHSKKSKYSSRGDEWRKLLLGKVVGDSLTIRQTLKLFDEGDVGIVGPHQFYLSHDSFWGSNYENVKRLLFLTGHFDPRHVPKLGFFAGSMFWFNPSALQFLKDIPAESLSFEPENGKQDGTLAHAIERVFCTLAQAAGYKVTSLYLAGNVISEIDTIRNRVPVL